MHIVKDGFSSKEELTLFFHRNMIHVMLKALFTTIINGLFEVIVMHLI